MRRTGRLTAKLMLLPAALLLAVLCLLTACTGGGGVVPTQEPMPVGPSAGTGYTAIDMTPKTDWKASWIWDGESASAENTWLVLRCTFECDSVPGELKADISADSRYWLYVNGSLAVYEGGLKRGPDAASGYYDTVDIAPYLKSGTNTVAALVWYWGKDGSFSYIDCGSGGFLFEAVGEGISVLSSSAWKVKRHPAFLNDTGDKQPNYRIAESNILFDARLDIDGWQGTGYDDSDWKQATVLSEGGSGVWGTLYPRPIPFLKVGALTAYENSAEFEGRTTKTTAYMTLDIPYNAQCVPYLCVEADAGREIEITTENTNLGSVITRYITKDGRQEFESPGWFNGEHVTYKIPAGVKIIALKYRESGYNTEFTGSFESDSDFFNSLWQKSLRTLYVTMRDNFMDCPDRERAQWWGDVTNEMAMTMYAMDAQSYLLYQKGVFNMLASAENGVLKTVVPAGENAYFELPMQQLAGICGFKTYYLYTGDRVFVDFVYEPARAYLDLWTQGPDGLVVHRPGSWDWMDWGDRADVVGIENAWYYMALDTVKYFAELRGDAAAAGELTLSMEQLYGAYQKLWTEKGFMGSVRRPDDRANALAVLAGLADLNNPERFAVIKNVLTGVFNSSPYMERYVLDALCEMGLVAEAQARIVKRYGAMVEEDYSTLWEYWDKSSGTMNHAWSGGPLITMSKYMAGVAPCEPGYGTYYVRPAAGSLNHIKCTVPSVRGLINVEVESGDTFRLTVGSPAGTDVIACVPRTGSATEIYYGGECIFACGEPAAALPEGVEFYGWEAGYICFKIATGAEARTFTLEAKEAAAAEDTVTVTLGTAEGGHVELKGRFAGDDGANAEHTATSGSVRVARGSTVTLTAVPDSGCEFAYFTGSAGGRDSSVELVCSTDMTVGAVFAPNRSDYSTLSVFVPEQSDLTVLINGRRVSFDGGRAEAAFPTGSEISVETRDGILHTFLNYSGAAESSEAGITVRLTGNLSLMINTNVMYGDNIARGAKATCTQSLESGTLWSVNNLTDGDLTTGFTTNVLSTVDGVLTKTVVINLDLGSVKEFSLLSFAPRTDTVSAGGGSPCYPMEFTVKVSRGGSEYTEAGTFVQEDNPRGTVQSYELGQQKARFVRIEIRRTGELAVDEGVADAYRVQLTEIMLRDRK